MKRLLQGMALLVLLGATAQAAVQMQVDRDHIRAGETFQLEISTDGDGDPDLSALEKDFQILGRGSSSQTQIINGHMSSRRVWTLRLAPKPGVSHGKSVHIPAIRVGKEQTSPIDLPVADGPTASGGKRSATAPAAVSLALSSTAPFVQQQIVVDLDIVFDASVRDVSLSLPDSPGIKLTQLGEDKQTRIRRNGRPMIRIQRRYALVAAHSGEITLGRFVLQGKRLLPRRRSRDPFDGFFGRDLFDAMSQPAEPVVIYSDPVTLNVRPIPDEWIKQTSGAPWLPAESLSLSASQEPAGDQARVGQPITRTLVLEARGAEAEQLPDVPTPELDNARVYADQPRRESAADAHALVAREIVKWAINPTRADDLRLPGVAIPWWDVKQNAIRWARLDAQTLKVQPGAEAPAPSRPVAPPPVTSQRSEAASGPATEPGQGDGGKASAPAEPASDAPPPAWQGLAPWLLSLVLALLWINERRLRTRTKPLAKTQNTQAREDPAAIYKACERNDPHAARAALMAWARARWPEQPPIGPVDVAIRLGADAAPFEALDRALYGEHDDWRGEALKAVLKTALQNRKGASDKARQDPLGDPLAWI